MAGSKDDMIRCMQRSIIFYIHTHGDQDAFYIDTEGVWLTMEDLEDVDLTQLDLVGGDLQKTYTP